MTAVRDRGARGQIPSPRAVATFSKGDQDPGLLHGVVDRQVASTRVVRRDVQRVVDSKVSSKYALMWSGGKDSALALQRATAAGMQVTRLVNIHDAATHRVRFHATRVEMIQAQADAAGIELRAIGSSWPDLEARLVSELAVLRSEAFAGVVFADIHLTDVRAWFEDRVKAAGLEHVEPIWGEEPARLLSEFVATGGRAVITCVDLSRLDSSWLGRIIDEHFVDEITSTQADPCGENGEYHSFAFQGPAFARRVTWKPGEKRTEAGFAQLDLLPG